MTTTPTVGSTFLVLISASSVRLLSLRRKFSKRVLLLEFGPASLLIAEATLIQAGGVQLSHVSSFSLPQKPWIVVYQPSREDGSVDSGLLC